MFTHTQQKYTTFHQKRLHVDFLQDILVMYKDKVLIGKIEVVSYIPDYMIPVDFCQKISPSLILQLET